MNTYKTDGIIIRRTNIGEADRMLTLLTNTHGKIRVIAKGVRKITSRRAPTLEVFNNASFLIHRSRINYEMVVETQLLHAFETLRSDLKCIGEAYQMCEL